MKHLGVLFVSIAAAMILTGCVSFEYSGNISTPETSNVEIFTDSAKISAPYTVLGRAVVSGNYRDVSRERMMETLISKAEKSGADAVLIVEQQVIPAGEVSRPVFDTAFDFDDTNRSWSQIGKDVDITYGEVGHRRAQNIRQVNSYSRVIRAEFLKYKSGKAADTAAGK